MYLFYLLLVLTFISAALSNPISADVEPAGLVKRGLQITDADDPLKPNHKIFDDRAGHQVQNAGALRISPPEFYNRVINFMKAKVEKEEFREYAKYSKALVVHYEYPAYDDVEILPAAGIVFWSDVGDDDLRTRLDAAMEKWKTSQEFQVIKEHVKNIDVEITKVVGFGTGSVHEVNPWPAIKKDRIQELQERAALQIAMALSVQELLGNEPEVIFQEPIYSKAERAFLPKYRQKVNVVDDPDVFGMIDESTIFIAIGAPHGIFLHLANSEDLPGAIIASGVVREDEAVMKPTPEERERMEAELERARKEGIVASPVPNENPKLLELVAQYKNIHTVAERGAIGFGKHTTKFYYGLNNPC